jgi:hypothetical protein
MSRLAGTFSTTPRVIAWSERPIGARAEAQPSVKASTLGNYFPGAV